MNDTPVCTVRFHACPRVLYLLVRETPGMRLYVAIVQSVNLKLPRDPEEISMFTNSLGLCKPRNLINSLALTKLLSYVQQYRSYDRVRPCEERHVGTRNVVEKRMVYPYAVHHRYMLTVPRTKQTNTPTLRKSHSPSGKCFVRLSLRRRSFGVHIRLAFGSRYLSSACAYKC